MLKKHTTKHRKTGGNPDKAISIVKHLMKIINKNLEKYENASNFDSTILAKAFRDVISKKPHYNSLTVNPMVGKEATFKAINDTIQITLNNLEEDFKKIENDKSLKDTFLLNIDKYLSNDYIRLQYHDNIINITYAIQKNHEISKFEKIKIGSKVLYYYAKKSQYFQKILDDLQESGKSEQQISATSRVSAFEFYSGIFVKMRNLFDITLVENIHNNILALHEINGETVSNVIQAELQLPLTKYDTTDHYKEFYSKISIDIYNIYYNNPVICYIDKEYDIQKQAFFIRHGALIEKISALYGSTFVNNLLSNILQKLYLRDESNHDSIIMKVLQNFTGKMQAIDHINQEYEMKKQNVITEYEHVLSQLQTIYGKEAYDIILKHIVALRYLNDNNVADVIKELLNLNINDKDAVFQYINEKYKHYEEKKQQHDIVNFEEQISDGIDELANAIQSLKIGSPVKSHISKAISMTDESLKVYKTLPSLMKNIAQNPDVFYQENIKTFLVDQRNHKQELFSFDNITQYDHTPLNKFVYDELISKIIPELAQQNINFLEDYLSWIGGGRAWYEYLKHHTQDNTFDIRTLSKSQKVAIRPGNYDIFFICREKEHLKESATIINNLVKALVENLNKKFTLIPKQGTDLQDTPDIKELLKHRDKCQKKNLTKIIQYLYDNDEVIQALKITNIQQKELERIEERASEIQPMEVIESLVVSSKSSLKKRTNNEAMPKSSRRKLASSTTVLDATTTQLAPEATSAASAASRRKAQSNAIQKRLSRVSALKSEVYPTASARKSERLAQMQAKKSALSTEQSELPSAKTRHGKSGGMISTRGRSQTAKKSFIDIEIENTTKISVPIFRRLQELIGCSYDEIKSYLPEHLKNAPKLVSKVGDQTKQYENVKHNNMAYTVEKAKKLYYLAYYENVQDRPATTRKDLFTVEYRGYDVKQKQWGDIKQGVVYEGYGILIYMNIEANKQVLVSYFELACLRNAEKKADKTFYKMFHDNFLVQHFNFYTLNRYGLLFYNQAILDNRFSEGDKDYDVDGERKEVYDQIFNKDSVYDLYKVAVLYKQLFEDNKITDDEKYTIYDKDISNKLWLQIIKQSNNSMSNFMDKFEADVVEALRPSMNSCIKLVKDVINEGYATGGINEDTMEEDNANEDTEMDNADIMHHVPNGPLHDLTIATILPKKKNKKKYYINDFAKQCSFVSIVGGDAMRRYNTSKQKLAETSKDIDAKIYYTHTGNIFKKDDILKYLKYNVMKIMSEFTLNLAKNKFELLKGLEDKYQNCYTYRDASQLTSICINPIYLNEDKYAEKYYKNNLQFRLRYSGETKDIPVDLFSIDYRAQFKLSSHIYGNKDIPAQHIDINDTIDIPLLDIAIQYLPIEDYEEVRRKMGDTINEDIPYAGIKFLAKDIIKTYKLNAIESKNIKFGEKDYNMFAVTRIKSNKSNKDSQRLQALLNIITARKIEYNIKNIKYLNAYDGKLYNSMIRNLRDYLQLPDEFKNGYYYAIMKAIEAINKPNIKKKGRDKYYVPYDIKFIGQEIIDDLQKKVKKDNEQQSEDVKIQKNKHIYHEFLKELFA